MIAQCYLDMDIKTEEAIELSFKALSLGEGKDYKAMSHGRLARGYAKLGDCEKAKKHLKIYQDSGLANKHCVVNQIIPYCKNLGEHNDKACTIQFSD